VVGAQVFEELLHQAPAGEGRLKQVEAYEGGEEVGPGGHEVAEGEGHHDEGARDGADVLLDGLFDLLFPRFAVSSTYSWVQAPAPDKASRSSLRRSLNPPHTRVHSFAMLGSAIR
jgi:hypothetical protein